MDPSVRPTAILSPLHRTDGSATFSQNGFEVIASVNGPLEVQRRDELAEEAAIDVIIRPARGVGGTRERHLESIVHWTLRQIILVQNFPRTVFQVTLQITSTPLDETSGPKLVQASSNLQILPALLQAATLALLSASLPLSATLTSVFFAVTGDGSNSTILQDPTTFQTKTADSLHVLAFTSHGDLLVAESEGKFELSVWNDVYQAGKAICCDKSTNGGKGSAMFVQSVLQQKVVDDLHWKS